MKIKRAVEIARNPRKNKIEQKENPLRLATAKDQDLLVSSALEKGDVVCPVCNQEVAMKMLKGKKTWVDTISGTMHKRCYEKAKRYVEG